jgi:hypothetical protein
LVSTRKDETTYRSWSQRFAIEEVALTRTPPYSGSSARRGPAATVAVALWRVERWHYGEQSDGASIGSGGREEGFFLHSHGDKRLMELTDARLGLRVTGVEV